MSPNINQAGSNTSWGTGPNTYWHSQVTWLHLSRNFPIKQLLCWKRHCFDSTEIAGKNPTYLERYFFFHLLSSLMGKLLKKLLRSLCLCGCLSKQSWTFSFGLKVLLKEIVNLKTCIMDLKIKKMVSNITKWGVWFISLYFVEPNIVLTFCPQRLGGGCFAVGSGGVLSVLEWRRDVPVTRMAMRGEQFLVQAQTSAPSSGCHHEPPWSSLLCWTVRGSGYSCHATSSTLAIFY